VCWRSRCCCAATATDQRHGDRWPRRRASRLAASDRPTHPPTDPNGDRDPMRIIVFGAAGNVGSRVVAEALSRDHEVTAVVRGRVDTSRLPAGVRTYLGDAGNSDDVAKLSAAQDVAISATRPAPGSEQELRAGREPCAARRQRHGDVPHDLRGWWGSRWSCSRRPSPPSLAWPSSGIRTTDRARARICPHLDPTESRAFWRLPEP
jgi:hypothetical protein